MTITAAYGGFFLAEASAIGASGVLTTVIIGLTMSMYGKTAISPSAEHFLHEFWEMMGFLANTLIFILSGLIIVGPDRCPVLREILGSDQWCALKKL